MQSRLPQSGLSGAASSDVVLHQDLDVAAPSSNKPQKPRHRASIACVACRERRIRCVVPFGDHGCVQCARLGCECIIRNDDERRRPISRAYMAALTDRVSMLESLLKERGAEVPPGRYPPQTYRGNLHADGDESPVRRPDASSHVAPKVEQQSPQHFPDGSSSENRSDKNSHVGTPVDDKEEGLIRRLLSTRGHLSFDQLSGRLRFYGGTVNCHVYSELSDVDHSEAQRLEQARRAQKCIRTLSEETHDYLLDLFWQHYNSVLHVVHQEAFNEDRHHGRTQFYSGFLHVCILAMAYRFSDKSRPDMQRIALPNRESSLHREAKYMLDLELEHPGGVPSIAALLILGDSEVGVGRDNVGWMYAGMAMRLCYDLGLQLDSRSAGLSQREMDVRRTTLWACVIYDRYWSLFLGRPLTMKSRDLEMFSLTDQFGRLGTCMPGGAGQSLNTKIYEALIELMEIAGKIVEEAEFRDIHDQPQGPDQPAFFKMATLDRELRNWAARLAPELRWNEENKLKAPLSYYLLHQQFYAVLILLHRPFARYDDAGSTESEEMTALDSQFSPASRAICTKSAVEMARIFWQHRQRFDGKTMFCIGMQHAGAAATALIAALAYMPDATERYSNLHHLEVLHAALQDMTHAYSPAEQMAAVLNAVMMELRGDPISPTTANAPRRGSVDLEAGRGTAKRRQTSHRNDPHSMPPPPISHPSSRRSSFAAPENTFQQQMTPQQQYMMAPPPPQQNLWPGHVSAPHIQTTSSSTLPPHAVPLPPSPSTRQAWTHAPMQQQQQQPQNMSGYSHIAGVPGVLVGDMAHLEFVNGLPSTWSAWQAPADAAVTAAVTATDLDGFPPRGRYVTPYPMPAHAGEYPSAAVNESEYQNSAPANGSDYQNPSEYSNIANGGEYQNQNHAANGSGYQNSGNGNGSGHSHGHGHAR